MDTAQTAALTELKNRDELVRRLRSTFTELLEGGPVVLAYLHGSAVRGTSTPLSDVDVAVVIRADADLAQRIDAEAQLTASLVGQGISKPDVRIINDAPIMLKGAVVTEGILLYAADEAYRIDFESLTRRQYFDYAPVARRMQDEYIRAVLDRPERGAKATR
jgi:predicted nucleotidyltransferase